MKQIFEEAIFTRNTLIKFLHAYTHNQLVSIPSQFNNSIFWNIAHLLVTPQLLCYKRSGLDIEIDEGFASRYAKGSRPDNQVPASDINYVKEILISSFLKLENDYKEGKFKNYEPYMTSTGIELTNIKDALKFSSFHDGIHLGVILSLKKLV